MAESQAPAAPAGSDGRAEPNHGLRIFLIWIVLALVADLLIWFVWYPHLPPGRMSESAEHQQLDIAVLALAAAPVMLFVWTYFGYTLVNWRHRDGDDDDGPPIFGHTGLQATWIGGTAVIVLAAFVFGTVELIVPAGAGAGEGPLPVWKPSGHNLLQVQVIGQQWQFTYRYPQFGGMESTTLVLPDNRPVEFHVTSLDVIHSFWAYLLAVKADANPNVDNVAYTTPKHTGGFTVRCSELCGIWHGAMFDSGRVTTPTAFQAWARATELREHQLGVLAALPPYALTYDPTVVPQLGQEVVKVAGITGANGYYYPPSDPEQP
ncbi:MAG: cytochrome c oxidase subunit [Actinomycetia bacterium]|jgi:cytochrome c oxidase subunit 2|nr:cytochrome c oxidase subunit [Actinomycetes bacterium]MDX6336265.1 cytochrome c oxidase subunit [Streptosporangiaceae bacterium]